MAMLGERICPKQFPVPATAGSYVPHSYERLSLDD
jgi:hypothetical protein